MAAMQAGSFPMAALQASMQTAMAVNTALMALLKAGEQTLLLSIALRLRPLHTDSPRAPD